MFLATIVSSFLFCQNILAKQSSIIISEIGAYEKSGYEWVEIFNRGNKAIDLAGWKFWEDGVSHRLSVSTTNSVVESGEYVVIVQDEKKFKSKYPDFKNTIFDSSWGSLKESGEEIGLQDKNKEFVEKFVYLKATKSSLQRKSLSKDGYGSDNWVEHASGNSVGGVNVFKSVATSSSVVIPLIEKEFVSSSTYITTTSLPIEPVIVTSVAEEKIATSSVVVEKIEEVVKKDYKMATTSISTKPAMKQQDVVVKAVTSTSHLLPKNKEIKKAATTSKEVVKKEDKTLYLSVAQARQQVKGSKVQVGGVVTVLPGIFGSQYFYIQDSTGGIQVYQYRKDFPTLGVGDQVSVFGEISVSRGQKRVKVKSSSDIKVLRSGVSIKVVSSGLSNLDENDLGRLVKVGGTITEIKGNYMYIDDREDEMQVYLKNGAKINKKKYKEGQEIELLGVLEQGSKGWQIWPRSSKDLTSVENGAASSSASAKFKHEQNNVKQTTEKYLKVTAGGISSVLFGFLAKAHGGFAVQGIKKFGLVIVGIIKK